MKSRLIPALILSAMALPVHAADQPHPDILFIPADDLGGKDLASQPPCIHQTE